MTTIYKQFTFDAAHYLPNVPPQHKCRQLHGHTYQLTIHLAAKTLQMPEQWVMDFTDIKHIAKPVIDQLDHHLLNDIPGLSNPTAEVLTVWLWEKLKPGLPLLSRIELKETPTSGVIYEGL